MLCLYTCIYIPILFSEITFHIFDIVNNRISFMAVFRYESIANLLLIK